MAKNFTSSEDQLQPDAKYGSLLVSKFVNCMMRDGKKSVALRVFYDALEIIKKKLPDASELDPRPPHDSGVRREFRISISR